METNQLKKEPSQKDPHGVGALYEVTDNAVSLYHFDALTPIHHFHNHLELVYTINGDTVAIADEKTVHMSTGDLFLTFPNQIHHYRDCAKGAYYVLLFDEQLCSEYSSILHYSVLKCPVFYRMDQNSVILSLLQRIDAVYEKTEEPMHQTVLKGYLCALLGELLMLGKTQSVHSSDTDTIRSIVNYCSQNYTKKLTLDTLSHDLHISKYHISHLFTSKMNVSFNDYLNSLRISDACRQLQGDVGITQTAFAVGFSSIRSFNRAFQKFMEMTPRQYTGQFHQEQKKS